MQRMVREECTANLEKSVGTFRIINFERLTGDRQVLGNFGRVGAFHIYRIGDGAEIVEQVWADSKFPGFHQPDLIPHHLLLALVQSVPRLTEVGSYFYGRG